MSLTGSDLADSIRIDMNFPTPTSTQLIGWGKGVVQHIQTGQVDHALVTGDTAPGAPLANGAAIGGIISGLDGASMASLVQTEAGYPNVSSELSAFCQEIVNHIQSSGLVNFDPGQITGQCTSTPLSPGPLTNGAGTGGIITGLDGNTLAGAIHGSAGYPGSTSPELVTFCTAIVNYVMDNAEIEYTPGSVVGTCPAGGGPLQGGAATGGTIL
ncbi:MAG: hypothetical protein GWN01_00780 [Nitrosopumilaceae archaeon]|nr:hypothetical protein [Nitrosopumilaceae archaeon]NIU85885.1 hypothetical protein [Nitrosopumilaceae archaeon]NIX60118.1 hypothetical protein [Nitrosopumilaceae archaeon]